MTKNLNLDAALKISTNSLKSAKIPNPEIDARLLVSNLFDIKPLEVFRNGNKIVSNGEQKELERRINARLGGMPVSRIIESCEFYGIEIKIDNSTFEPRPDTEILVDSVIDWLKDTNRTNELINVVDIGTGTGAILIALLSELPNAVGIGTDICSKTIEHAKKNIIRVGLEHRSKLVCSSFTEAINQEFDVIVSNPPYIPSREIEFLQPEVKNYDPIRALDGGEDGLAAYRRILGESCDKLKQNGRIFVEIGFGQLQSVSMIFKYYGYVDLKFTKDLSGISRVISASRDH